MTTPAWVRCACGDFWCRIHRTHTADCPCPPIEDWTIDPYSPEEPTPMTDYTIEEDCDGAHVFTATDAVERSTGWLDCHIVNLDEGTVEFFDAEENVLVPVSAIGTLARAIRKLKQDIENEAYDYWDPADDYPVPLTFANTGCHR